MNSQRIKRWTVNVVSNEQTPLTLFCDGRPLTQSLSATLDDVSPVHHLLISLASCFALSCRAVLVDTKRPRVSFEVVAASEKVPSIPSRLSKISMVAIFGSGITESEAALVMAQATPLCTVTNTFLESTNIEYGSRTIRELRADTRKPLPPQAVH